MKITSITKAAIAFGVNALVLGGLVAGPASADPGAGVYGDLVGTGSDTIQDVDNGLSTALGNNPDTGNRYLASYDAAPASGNGSVSGDCGTANDKITTQLGATAFTRPNGSGNGRDTLRAAIGQAASASVKSFACGLSGGSSSTLNATDVRGLVQYARSSGGPSSGDTTAAGVLTYIPFAKDAVSVAVSPDSKIPALTFGTAAVNTSFGGTTGKVEPTLYAIYTCKATKVIVPDSGPAFLANGDYTGPGTAHDLHVYIPQSGSGTRSFWIGKFNVTEANITAAAANASCLKDKIQPADSVTVQEHNGTAVGSDDYAIMPFSIPQYVAQSNGVVTSKLNGAVIRGIGGVAATTSSGGTLSLNPSFTTSSASSMLGRLVYHIVPSREADDPNSLTHEVFVGRDSRVCQASSTISQYGFALLTATSGSSSCGNTSVRAYAPSTASITIEVVDAATSSANTVTSAVEGNTVYFRVKNITDYGKGGGTIQLSDGAGNVFHEFSVPANSDAHPYPVTATNSTWVYESVTLNTDLPAGQYDVVATFIPTLPGVETKTAANLISFTLDQRTIDSIDAVADSASLKVKKKGIVDVSINATGITPTGTVTIFQGVKALGTADLDENGDAHVVFSKKFTKKGNLALTVSYSGDGTYVADTTDLTVTVRK